MLRPPLAVVLAINLATLSPAQSPSLTMSPSAAVGPGGATSNYTVAAPPARVFGLFADFGGGPVDVLGERIYLSLSAWLTTLHVGVMPAGGSVGGSFTLPTHPSLVGVVVYGQAIVLDAGAPNGLFVASNGASTCYSPTATAIVAAFDNPIADGYTGTFATDVPGHLHGGAVTSRRRETNDLLVPAGALNYPLQGELTPYGGRGQHVYRPVDLAATGEPELITAIHWSPFAQSLVMPDTFPIFEIRLGHAPVTPDFSVDPWSALAMFPNSGLSANFAANELLGAPPVTVSYGPFVIDPATAIYYGPFSTRYLPLPGIAPFVYDGTRSLLLELRVPPSTALGLNGFQSRLMVQSGPLPAARAVARGSVTNPLSPSAAVFAQFTDCAVVDLLIDLVRVHTFALSPWLDSQAGSPNYGLPIVALSLPPGTGVQVEYRGATSAAGANATAWSSSPDVADGFRYLQFRITFVADHVTGERPVIDTLVVPIS